jgi:hypothetical protein
MRADEAVILENATKATRCAEEDNVYVKFIGAGITHFTVEAHHPAYVASMGVDNKAPDFSDCDMSQNPSFTFEPKRVMLYEGMGYTLIGYTFSTFWRPDIVAFRVGDTVTKGLHLVQLFRSFEGRRIEILVVYPADGYWRLKPLPLPGQPETAYGSSFLVGPVKEQGRPIVEISMLEFFPETVSFAMSFESGEGRLQVTEASSERTRLEIAVPSTDKRSAFAALRSMFVSPVMADTAEIILTDRDGRPRTFPILDAVSTEARSAIFARSIPSRHNTSAPDLRIGDFRH